MVEDNTKYEKVIIREVVRETPHVKAWESGAFAGLVILSFVLPLVGIIMGGLNMRHQERQGQAVGLFVASIAFWAFWIGVLK